MKYKFAISVIMPCYNYEKYVQAAIESILNQSLTNFEFIIINDGSIDRSHSIITSFRDERIKYIHIKENIGNYAARNRGLDLAQGKYIAIMDADDLSVPDRFLIQYEYMEKNPRIGCIGTYGRVINEKDVPGGVLKKISNYQDIKIALMRNNCFLHPSLMIRRHFLKKFSLRYDESLTYSSDYDFMCLCSRYFIIKNLPEILLMYRMHKEQISSEKTNEQKKFADLIQLRQVAQLDSTLSIENKALYLNLMNNTPLSKAEIDKSIDLMNSLLDQNQERKLYSHVKLFTFFRFILRTAIFIQKKTTSG